MRGKLASSSSRPQQRPLKTSKNFSLPSQRSYRWTSKDLEEQQELVLLAVEAST